MTKYRVVRQKDVEKGHEFNYMNTLFPSDKCLFTL